MKIIIASMIATLGFSSAVNAEEQCHKLVWQDHFDQPQLNPKNWQVTTGDGCDISLCGWGNNEVQWYSEDNLSINDGKLVIMARAEEKGGRNYTSAKINSEGRFYQQYGRFEARLRLPSVRGAWPAFWLMPQNMQHPWPIEGEIDILEQPGRDAGDAQTIIGAIHFGKPAPHNEHYAELRRVPYVLNDGFHVFAVDWAPGIIKWSVDGVEHARVTPEDVKPYPWPFDNKDEPFYVILNLALGGSLGGVVPDDFESATYEVDYVKVFKNEC